MSTIEHRVIYAGGAQSIVTRPIDRYGRVTYVSSATYTIVDERRSDTDANRVVQASTAATIDSTSTTTTAAVAAGAKSAAVTSSVGFTAGRRYIITETDGRREELVCEGTATGIVYFRHAVSRDYTMGATVRGVEVTGTFPAPEAADEPDQQSGGGPYRVSWTWDTGLGSETVTETVWVVRHRLWLRVSEADILRIDQTLRERIGSRLSLADALMAALDDVDALLRLSQQDPDGVRSYVLQRAVLYRAAWHARRQCRSPEDKELADEHLHEFDRLIGAHEIGSPPRRTVVVDQREDTASPGGSSEYVVGVRRL